jgi:hypothetical protein
MFIGTVVLGAVVGASKGASVRGALIRDVSAYALAVAMVAWIISSGQVRAPGCSVRGSRPWVLLASAQHQHRLITMTTCSVLQVTRGKALLLLCGYVLYVLAVCAADITHRMRRQSQQTIDWYVCL